MIREEPMGTGRLWHDVNFVAYFKELKDYENPARQDILRNDVVRQVPEE
jgi:hypothetical protein